MKKMLLLTVLVGLACQLLAQSNCLEASFPFEGNTADETGNGYDGINFGAVLTDGYEGELASAFKLDGYDDYIQLNANQPIIEAPPFSFTIWVRMDGQGGGTANINPVFSQRDDQTTGAQTIIGFQTEDAQGDVQFGMRGSNMGSITRMVYSGSPSYGEWHFYAVTVEDNGFARMYIDTTIVATVHYGNVGRLDQSVNFNYLGKHSYYHGTSGYFNGAIDNFRIHDCALTKEEIKNEYYGIVLGDESNDVIPEFDVAIDQQGRQLWLKGLDRSAEYGFKIYSTSGQVVHSGIASLASIDVAQMPQGVYLLTILDNDRNITTKKIALH